jgi:DtxR family transcriptional regulator, Mn-dependent transcriptional regulator
VSDELTPAVEDYVREIYKLQHERGRATTSALAERMGVSAPSATGMIKRLASLSLVEHERYRGVVLTRAGEKKAIELIRHHRLLEQYLAEALGLPIDAVHAEADRLEHALSEEVEARIDASLGYPTHDPHGDPIPDARLYVAAASHGTLAALGVGDRATVRRIPDGDPQVVRYLASMELLPSRAVEVVESAPFDGPLTIVVGGTRHAISRELALQIHVG